MRQETQHSKNIVFKLKIYLIGSCEKVKVSCMGWPMSAGSIYSWYKPWSTLVEGGKEPNWPT